MQVAIVSSVYGNYDPVKVPVTQSLACDWIMVTDREDCVNPPWRAVVEPRPQLHPRLAAKVARCNPQLYSDADVLIYIDGNVSILSPDFLAFCIESLGNAALCLYPTPNRETIYKEAAISGLLEKYQGLPVMEQATWYVDHGLPENFGSWWNGCMIRSKNCPEFGNAWLAEMVRWTIQDQISLPWVMYSMGLFPKPLSAEIFGHISLSDHNRED